MKNEKLLCEKAYQLAYKYEQEREHCAQCTLIAIMETCESIDKDLIKAVDGLTGGTALSIQGTCGALAAGLMALSSITGRSYEAFKSGEVDHNWEYVIKLYEKFVNEYGSPLGYKVQEKLFGRYYNLRDKDERLQFEKEGAHVDKCPSVCGNVAKWVVEMLLENEDLNKRMV